LSSLIEELVESVHGRYLDERSGEILHGIPALEDVDPDSFGICLATADGYVYEAGDTGLPFCIQSISKPFTYGIALTDQGIEAVDAKIEVEPSGELYNEISLNPATHRPRNPMINAGALVAASLVAGGTPEQQVERIASVFSAYAGRELTLDEDVFASQVASGHRNRAIGHMLREFGILEDDPNIAHEVYLRACSTMVTCRDLSLMGATWANGGTNPLTGEEVLSSELTERVLSVMATCGMYDAAGEWVAEVGMSAKSGVGGGIVAVLPGQLSIAAFSPRLDVHGNSVRAFKACRQLSHDLELHAFHVARGAESAIRASYDIVEAPSAVQRPEADRRVLEQHGRRARIVEVQGDLLFAGVESVVREISRAAEDDVELLVVDVRRITEVADVSRRLLLDLREFLRERGCEAFLVDPDGLLSAGPGVAGDARPTVFGSIAAATVFFEDELLKTYGEQDPAELEFDFYSHPALVGVESELVERLRGRLRPRSFADGEMIVAQGDAEAGVFLIMRGRVRSSLTTGNGAPRSLATLTPGNCFGDVYVVTGNPHPLTMHADGPVDALEMTRSEFERISHEDPELHAATLNIFMYEIHKDVDRALHALATGRIAVR
jgi:glutaminase